METSNGGNTISYTVRELLAEISASVKDVAQDVRGQGDRLGKVESRLSQVEGRLAESANTRRWQIGTAIALLVALCTVGSLIVAVIR